MPELIIVAIAALLLIALSLRANTRFRQEEKLPMQWSFSGSVNWTAPRVLALSFTPALAICILAISVFMMSVSTPRAGQEGFEAPVIALLAIGFLGVHLLHLWMIERWLRGHRR